MSIANAISRSTFIITMLLTLAVCAFAQAAGHQTSSFSLGDVEVVIPAPNGFEEAASQFERIKTRFTLTEAPDNEMLAVHLTKADCDMLRRGESASLGLYTKVSVLRIVRDQNFSDKNFAALIAELRQHSAEILDMNSPKMKAMVKHLDDNLSELNKEKTQVEFPQPINLGEIDARPNVYSIMLILTVKTKRGDSEVSNPFLCGVSFLRIKQRLVYVYTYSKYRSKDDIEVLRGFTTKWIGQILAEN